MVVPAGGGSCAGPCSPPSWSGSLLLLTGGWVGFRGWQARAHLLNAAGLARELSAQVVGGDTARAQRTLAALQEQSGSARAATGDPGWWVGRHAPYAGDNLAAVRQISVAIDDLAGRRSRRCCAPT